MTKKLNETLKKEKEIFDLILSFDAEWWINQLGEYIIRPSFEVIVKPNLVLVNKKTGRNCLCSIVRREDNKELFDNFINKIRATFYEYTLEFLNR